MKNKKIKIYGHLLPLCIFAGMGLFSLVNHFTNPGLALPSEYYLWGVGVGLIMWWVDGPIIYRLSNSEEHES